MSKLDDNRNKINVLDRELAALFEKRMQCVA
ncbi:MAG: chorismate mutase, partial [Clostridiales bacterium]|nr:chorismate mutase [Clostridiales bacterium]